MVGGCVVGGWYEEEEREERKERKERFIRERGTGTREKNRSGPVGGGKSTFIEAAAKRSLVKGSPKALKPQTKAIKP